MAGETDRPLLERVRLFMQEQLEDAPMMEEDIMFAVEGQFEDDPPEEVSAAYLHWINEAENQRGPFRTRDVPTGTEVFRP